MVVVAGLVDEADAGGDRGGGPDRHRDAAGPPGPVRLGAGMSPARPRPTGGGHDSGGLPWSGRELSGTGFDDDRGEADPRLLAALRDPGTGGRAGRGGRRGAPAGADRRRAR